MDIMSTRTITIVQGVPIYEDTATGRCWMTADADIDCDGRNPNYDNDPYYQNDTALHNNGQALDAYSEPYMVLPPAAIKGVSGIVMGCQCRVHYLRTGKISDGVVGDIGPRLKIGELSVCLAMDLGMPHNPNTGGESNFGMVVYEWWPGQAAYINGIQYHLQASK